MINKRRVSLCMYTHIFRSQALEKNPENSETRGPHYEFARRPDRGMRPRFSLYPSARLSARVFSLFRARNGKHLSRALRGAAAAASPHRNRPDKSDFASWKPGIFSSGPYCIPPLASMYFLRLCGHIHLPIYAALAFLRRLIGDDFQDFSLKRALEVPVGAVD